MVKVHLFWLSIYVFFHDRRKGRKQHFLLFCFSFQIALHKELARSRAARAGGSRSGVAHQARGAGEGLAHAHALLLVDAEGVGFDGQLVLQPALGHYQQLQCVLRLPQPQLEGLQRVVDGEHLVYEPGARAEEKAQFIQPFNTDAFTRCRELCQALGDRGEPDRQGSAIREDRGGRDRQVNAQQRYRG